MYLLDYEKTGSFKGGGVGVFHSVLPSSIISLCACLVIKLRMNLVRGRKGNGRRGKKTMERGKGKGNRIMAYLRWEHGSGV